MTRTPRENSTKRLALEAMQNPNMVSLDDVIAYILSKRPELKYDVVLKQIRSLINQMKKGNILANKYVFLEDGLHIKPIVPKVDIIDDKNDEKSVTNHSA